MCLILSHVRLEDNEAFQRIDQRIFGQREIPKLADERRQNMPVFFVEGRFDLGRCGHPTYCFCPHSGRISIEPSFALGILAAQRIASSRSWQSST